MPISFDPRPVFLDALGQEPNSGGSVAYYESGSDVPKAIYSDNTLGVAIANPQPLGIDGRSVAANGVWLGLGSYRVRLYDIDGAEIWTVDGIEGTTNSASGGSSLVAETMADLRALDPAAAEAVILLGYYAAGDGGGGVFRWSAGSLSADDGGAVVEPDAGGAGRWLRQFTEEATVRMWGAVPGLSGNNEVNILRAQSFCTFSSQVQTLCIGAGTYALGADLTLTGAYTLRVMHGASFSADAPRVVTIDTDYVKMETMESICGTDVTLEWDMNERCKPEWWGVTGAAGEATLWQNVNDGCNGATIELSQQYTLEGVESFVAMHFGRGSSLIISAATDIATISWDERPFDEPLFFMSHAVGTQLLTLSSPVVRSWWFSLGSPMSQNAYERMVVVATNKGAREGVVQWCGLPTYELCGNSSYEGQITHSVSEGTVLSVAAATTHNLYKFESGAFQSLDPATAGTISLESLSELEWWGGTATQGSAALGAKNVAAIVAAIAYSLGVDGRGRTYNLSGNSAINFLTASNLTLTTTSGAVLTCAIGQGCDLTDCKIYNGTLDIGTNVQAAVQLRDCDVGADFSIKSALTEIDSCYFQNDLTVLSSTAAGESSCSINDSRIGDVLTINAPTAGSYMRAVVNGCTADELLMLKCRTSSVTGCRVSTRGTFQDGTIAGTGLLNHAIVGNYFGALYITSTPTNCTISGNTVFDEMNIEDATDCAITGNTAGQINLDGLLRCAISGNVSQSASSASWVGTNCSVVGNVGEGLSYTGFITPVPTPVASFNK